MGSQVAMVEIKPMSLRRRRSSIRSRVILLLKGYLYLWCAVRPLLCNTVGRCCFLSRSRSVVAFGRRGISAGRRSADSYDPAKKGGKSQLQKPPTLFPSTEHRITSNKTDDDGSLLFEAFSLSIIISKIQPIFKGPLPVTFVSHDAGVPKGECSIGRIVEKY